MKNIIMKRLNCTEKEAALIADDLNMVSPQLKSAVAAWLENGAIDETIEAEGYTLGYLMKEYDMQFTGAILTIDWLLKSPQEARKAIACGIR